MQKITDNATIVDVRTPGEFSHEHISNAVNIPVEEIDQRINEFRDMSVPIITYCRSGNRSGIAVSILKQNGITSAYNGGSIDELKQIMNG
jgi:phage shock protein E